MMGKMGQAGHESALGGDGRPSHRLRRREVVLGTGPWIVSATGLMLLSSACELAPSQTRVKIPRLGFLGTQDRDVMADRVDAFLEGLREVGYVEGQTITIDWRFLLHP